MLLRHTQVWWPEGLTLQVGAADGKCRPQLARLKHYTEKSTQRFKFIHWQICLQELGGVVRDWRLTAGSANQKRRRVLCDQSELALKLRPENDLTDQCWGFPNKINIKYDSVWCLKLHSQSEWINLKWLFQFCKKGKEKLCQHDVIILTRADYFSATEKQTERRPADSNPP